MSTGTVVRDTINTVNVVLTGVVVVEVGRTTTQNRPVKDKHSNSSGIDCGRSPGSCSYVFRHPSRDQRPLEGLGIP